MRIEERGRARRRVRLHELPHDRAGGDRARRRTSLEARGLPQTEFSRVKKLAAEQKGIKVGDDMIDYLLDQLHRDAHALEQRRRGLRRGPRPPPPDAALLKKHLELDEALDTEVRGKLKHVQEGSRTWEVEYQRVMGDIQRRKGLRARARGRTC